MKNKFNIAVIDVGTLKSKLEIREFDENLNSKTIFKDKQLTVLGRDLVKDNNVIVEKSVVKVIAALFEFKTKMEFYKVKNFKAVTTEAIRKASNSKAVLDRIKEETGILLETLTQKEEAEIFFKSVSKDFPNKVIAVCDIGGGSVQVAIGKDETLFETHLFKTGTYFLQEEFSKTHHPTLDELDNAKAYIKDQLSILKETKTKPEYIIYGSTNIIEFLETMKCNLQRRPNHIGDHPYMIDVNELYALYEKIIALSYEDRMPLYEKEPYYMWAADKALMNIFQISAYLKTNAIIPTNNNISSGILYELAKHTQ